MVYPYNGKSVVKYQYFEILIHVATWMNLKNIMKNPDIKYHILYILQYSHFI